MKKLQPEKVTRTCYRYDLIVVTVNDALEIEKSFAHIYSTSNTLDNDTLKVLVGAKYDCEPVKIIVQDITEGKAVIDIESMVAWGDFIATVSEEG